MRSYVPGGPCGMAAGVITAEATYIPQLFARINLLFYEMLGVGVGHSEETCLVYLYTRHPEMFNIYYGDYYSLMNNYFEVHRDYPSVRYYFIEKTLQDGRVDLAKAAAKHVLDSYEQGLVNFELHEADWLRSVLSR